MFSYGKKISKKRERGLQIEDAEQALSFLVRTVGFEVFGVALNNAFIHGEIVPDITEEDLTALYDGIDRIFNVAKKYKKG